MQLQQRITTTKNCITSRKIHNIPRASVGGTCVGEEGRKRRLGFGKKGKSSFTVHRSEEVLPEDTVGGRSGRQPSSASSDGEGSGDGDRSDIRLFLTQRRITHLSFSHLSLYFFHQNFCVLARERATHGSPIAKDAHILKLFIRSVTMNILVGRATHADDVASSS